MTVLRFNITGACLVSRMFMIYLIYLKNICDRYDQLHQTSALTPIGNMLSRLQVVQSNEDRYFHEKLHLGGISLAGLRFL